MRPVRVPACVRGCNGLGQVPSACACGNSTAWQKACARTGALPAGHGRELVRARALEVLLPPPGTAAATAAAACEAVGRGHEAELPGRARGQAGVRRAQRRRGARRAPPALAPLRLCHPCSWSIPHPLNHFIFDP